MSHYYENRTIFLLLCIFVSLMIIFTSCKKIVPEFDSKEYSPSALANTACGYLNPDTSGRDYYLIDAMPMDSLVDSTRLANSTHTEIINESFNQLIQSVNSITAEDLLIVRYEASALGDTTYLSYQHNMAQKDMAIFITWSPFTTQNLNEFIDLDIIKSNGSFISKNTDIPLETISGCIDSLVYNLGDTQVTEWYPMIKNQLKVNLENDSYLVRVINSQPLRVGPFRMVILPQ